MHPALRLIRDETRNTAWENDLFLVGGAVRDELLGRTPKEDFDLVTRGSSAELSAHLYDRGLAKNYPVTYARFGTAMVQVQGVEIEIVTARKESYDEDSRKPNVEPATYVEDALRRDFTVNTLRRSLHSGELVDPLGLGVSDLENRILRTPLDPAQTFRDDPLRMLRAVRFRHRLGFSPAPGLYDAIRVALTRLKIVSMERIRDEFLKMLVDPTGSDALEDLRELGFLPYLIPELLAMPGVEQGKYHHLDVWDHTRLVVQNVAEPSPILKLAALLHDVGKPATRTIDDEGNTRFFGHEGVGAEMTGSILRRLMMSERDVSAVANLVKNHMRLGSASTFSASAARRLIRDMGDQLEDLLQLVEADANGLRPGVRVLDLQDVRNRIEEVQRITPRTSLESPLSGEEIMSTLGLEPGRRVGELKAMLTEQVLEGVLAPDDREGAKEMLRQLGR